MSHLSTLALHRYHLGELPPPEAARAEAHLASCEPCQARLEAARAEDEAIASEPLPAFLAELDQHAVAPVAPAPSQWALFLRRVGMPGVSLLAAAILLLAALPVMQNPPPEAPGTRTRGELPDLEVWLQTDGGHRPLRVGEALGDGDEVVLFYHPHQAESVALAGRDASGQVEVYRVLHPVKDGLQPAPFGLTLDDAPGVQEFFLVAGPGGLSDAEVVEAIQRGDGSVTRVVIPKEPTR